jgi:hypothetical protein
MSLQHLASTSDSASSFAVGPHAVNPGSNSATAKFVDRRNSMGPDADASERRQFGSTHGGLSEYGRELALAIDEYKVQHHRRYLTCDEMLTVLRGLGYAKVS